MKKFILEIDIDLNTATYERIALALAHAAGHLDGGVTIAVGDTDCVRNLRGVVVGNWKVDELPR